MSHHHDGRPAAGAAGRDPFFEALDPLVRAGTLRPDQATAVLRAVTRDVGGARPWSAQERASAALAVLGAALALGAVTLVLAPDSGFAWKLFLVSVAGIGVIAGAAVAVRVLLPSSSAAEWVAGVMTALAILATGALILRLGATTTAIDYLAGVLMVVLGAAGYLLLRHSALTLPVVAGVLTLVVALLGDLVDPGGTSAHSTLLVGLAVAGVGVTVAGAGWFLPSRNVTAMIGGSIALLAMLGTIQSLATVRATVLAMRDDSTPDAAEAVNGIWIALSVGLLACVALVGLHALAQFQGYVVLVVLGITTLPVLAITSVSSDHPARWGAALAVTGLLVMVAALTPALLGRRAPASGLRQ